ncbi:MAG: hypothetical protein IPQ02_02485 [Saprospiraceae bacterium]|uniref:Uncharacterized protein n=1 Tax=Candidatus Defluviibacterium haderslevense TaxID=2981993 RepID=A0A9D7SB67_9BACT|nr:hypothetical protein [Candidatus Defluviibacterium haderslevense]MBL0235500.1 hypothetical protein [Candidatus Defluviibacterium haderslevense]
MKIHIFIIIFLLSFHNNTVFSQKIQFSVELIANPAFTKTNIKDFYGNKYSDTNVLIFGDEAPEKGIFGYNHGLYLGCNFKNKYSVHVGITRSLKGQRNSKIKSLKDGEYHYGAFSEYSNEYIIQFSRINVKLVQNNYFDFNLGFIISKQLEIIAGKYQQYSIWKGRSLIGSYDISYSQELNILRPGIITEVDYQLLKNKWFKFKVGIKWNHYFRSYNYPYFSSNPANKPKGYAMSFGPSFKLNYHTK